MVLYFRQVTDKVNLKELSSPELNSWLLAIHCWMILYFCFYTIFYDVSFLFPVLWRKLITKHGGQISNSLDVSSLAKITDGYTPGHMITACNQVLTERRISQLSKKPLQAMEFIAPLARMDPVYKEEEESYKVSRDHFVYAPSQWERMLQCNVISHWLGAYTE